MRELAALLVVVCAIAVGGVGCGGGRPAPEQDTAVDSAAVPEAERPAPGNLPPE